MFFLASQHYVFVKRIWLLSLCFPDRINIVLANCLYKESCPFLVIPVHARIIIYPPSIQGGNCIFSFPTNLRTNQFVTYENDGSSAMFYISSLLIQLPTILQMDFLSCLICLSLLIQLPTNYGLAHRDHLSCVYWTFYLLPWPLFVIP
jgi:hypothetical protein